MGEQQAASSGTARSQRAIRWLTIFSLGVALSTVCLGAALLLQERDEAWHVAEMSSTNLVLALERDISRNIATYDLSLQGVMEALDEPELATVPPHIRQTAMFDRAATAEFLGSMLVLDASGTIIADSTSLTPHALNFADRDYFTVHRDRPDAGLYLSHPFRSRLRNGDLSMSISRRLPSPDGGFRGVVVGTIRLAYFEELFSKLDVGRHGVVALSRTDGEVLVRLPPAPVSAGEERSPRGPAVEPEHAAGRFLWTSPRDGLVRLRTYRRIGTLPLMVTVAVGEQDVLEQWWRKAFAIGGILLALGGATVALCLLFRREMQRRLAAEAALVASAAQLTVIAATDGLTGLLNRRAFEGELSTEWRRAIRGKTPLALLLLDADWFKPYNDHYGHLEGDEVLRKVAAAILRNIRRPGDTGARYGGEEMVALLPDTDMAGALHTAERICASVAGLQVEHAGSPLGHVTVSVGVAVMRPVQGEDSSMLVRRADAAMYEAKRAGRARVVADPQGTGMVAGVGAV